MKILFINSVQTSPLTPLQCGEGKNEGVCGFTEVNVVFDRAV